MITSGYTKPVAYCPNCGVEWEAEWVDIGFGPYSQQAGPYHCDNCGEVEKGCPAEKCDKNRCISYSYCQGKAMRG